MFFYFLCTHYLKSRDATGPTCGYIPGLLSNRLSTIFTQLKVKLCQAKVVECKSIPSDLVSKVDLGIVLVSGHLREGQVPPQLPHAVCLGVFLLFLNLGCWGFLPSQSLDGNPLCLVGKISRCHLIGFLCYGCVALLCLLNLLGQVGTYCLVDILIKPPNKTIIVGQYIPHFSVSSTTL